MSCLTRAFLFELMHLISGRVISVLHRSDSIAVRSFGCLVALLPLPSLLSGTIDLLVRAVFNGMNVSFLALTLHS